MRKKFILAILIVLMIIVVGFIIYMARTGKIKPFAAGEVATLALSPNSGTKIIGTNFNVDILLNTNSRLTSGTDVMLNYNPQDLEVQDADSVAAGVQIKANTPTVYKNVAINSVDSTLGKIYYSAMIDPGTTGYSTGAGTAILATITFKVLRTATSPVTFNFTLGATNDTNVMSAGTLSPYVPPAEILLSVTNGSYSLVPADVPTTINLKLQGRSDFSTSGTVFRVYNTGTTTKIFEKTDVTTNASGVGSLTLTGVPAGNYDFRIKVGMYLINALINKPLTNPLTLDFGELRAGELNGDNIINTADYQVLLVNWFKNTASADINKDGIVNTSDFAWLSLNWLLQDQ